MIPFVTLALLAHFPICPYFVRGCEIRPKFPRPMQMRTDDKKGKYVKVKTKRLCRIGEFWSNKVVR
jgi:hypothetical protein